MAKKSKKTTPAILYTAASIEYYHELVGAPFDEDERRDVAETIIEHLGYLAETLKGGQVAIKGDGYGWTPQDDSMQNWLCSDGGELKTDSLLGLFCHALGEQVCNIELNNCWELNSGWVLMPAKNARRQDLFEAYY